MSLMFAVVAAFVCMAWVTANSQGDLEQQKPSIRADDIPDRAAIIGKLGIPLGQVATIRGRWLRTNGKGRNLVFRVTHLDGNHVDRRIEFQSVRDSNINPIRDSTYRPEDDNPVEGAEWEIRAWETGGFVGSPKQADAEWRGETELDIPYRSSEFGVFQFFHTLEYFKRRAVK